MSTKPYISRLVSSVALSSLLLAPLAVQAKPGDRAAKWKELDANGDGSVTLEEFRSPNLPFMQMDADGNGILEFSEVQAYRERKRTERQRARFDQLDLDDDGMVTQEEAVEGLFKKLDTNGDGVLSSADRRGRGRHGRKGHRFHHLGSDSPE